MARALRGEARRCIRLSVLAEDFDRRSLWMHQGLLAPASVWYIKDIPLIPQRSCWRPRIQTLPLSPGFPSEQLVRRGYPGLRSGIATPAALQTIGSPLRRAARGLVPASWEIPLGVGNRAFA